ncbi:probable membrane-associated kinase regulator 6 isoform X1 [Lotus japonicus]|uniref:probable membrane-associated kinase regulator 6 isoform X1 n=1 Tax=Lotus japonicus TaxID=34305 RepID=UPI002584098D|nr:probable membrane-associated kinase regulator 6 isoform X1 [Lotus japonicus]
METSSVPLASDSFSYSWLSNNKSPVDYCLDEPLRNSVSSECQNFNFDSSVTQSHVLVHADEIFCDGLLKPIFVDPSKLESYCDTPDFTQTKLISSNFSSRTVSSRTMRIHHGILTRLRKSTWGALVEIFRYVNQLRQKVRSSRKSTRVDDIGKTDWQVKSLCSPQRESPKAIIGDLHDHENSIYEAVLHCKRSIGN